MNDGRQVRGYCLEHPEEEISYFCFECMSQCICPECVIHGAHRNHEVQTIKRAYPIVRAKTEELVSQLADKVDELHTNEDKYNAKKKELADAVKMLRKTVTETFTDFRQKIDAKEKEFSSALDAILEDALKDVNIEVQQIGQKAQIFKETIEEVNQHVLSKEETLLLNYFANNSSKILESLLRNQDSGSRFTGDMNIKTLIGNNLNDVLDEVARLQAKFSALSLVAYNDTNSGTNLRTTTLNPGIGGARNPAGTGVAARLMPKKEVS
jgi:hypothetical protein